MDLGGLVMAHCCCVRATKKKVPVDGESIISCGAAFLCGEELCYSCCNTTGIGAFSRFTYNFRAELAEPAVLIPFNRTEIINRCVDPPCYHWYKHRFAAYHISGVGYSSYRANGVCDRDVVANGCHTPVLDGRNQFVKGLCVGVCRFLSQEVVAIRRVRS